MRANRAPAVGFSVYTSQLHAATNTKRRSAVARGTGLTRPAPSGRITDHADPRRSIEGHNIMQLISARSAIVTGIIVSTALAISLISQAGQEAPQSQPVPDKWAKHYYDRVAQFERENKTATNIVLVGSSHIEGFDTDKLLPGRRIVNRGISADRIGITERGILHRLDASVFDCNPGFVILENGVNDLGELWRNDTPSIDEIDACYRKVVKQIRTRLPDVPLVIIGLFPTRDKYAPLVPMIVEFNKRLARIAADFDCPFMDVYAPFADKEGLLRNEYSREGLHLTEAGYRQWAKIIESVLPPLPKPARSESAATRPADT